MKSLEDFRLLTEEEKSDYTKFDMLVRAGLANKAQLQRIHRIMDKMQEERPTFNNADRMIMQNLFNKMADLLANNKQIFMRTRQAVREEIEAVELQIGEEQELEIVEAKLDDFDPPFVLMLKRRAIRMYPDGTRVALYYNRQLNKYFSVPYGNTVDAAIQSEETESVDEHIVKSGGQFKLVSKSTGKNLGTYPTKAGAEKRERQVQYFKHHSEEVEQVEEAVMDTLHKIVAGKSAQSVKFGNGQTRKVDHFTASAITQVHKAVNDDNKKKLADMVHKSPAHFQKVADFAFSKAK
jgi:hypothetical protein